jgi:hypothetical protein
MAWITSVRSSARSNRISSSGWPDRARPDNHDLRRIGVRFEVDDNDRVSAHVLDVGIADTVPSR